MSGNVRGQVAFSGRLFDVEVLVQTGPDGRIVQREVVRHPGAVVVIPVLEDRRLAMIRNYRVATGERLWELPAGKLERGEDPQLAALRELEEETGYRARAIDKLGEFYTSPGFADELIRAFLAEDLEQVGQCLEAGEDIELERLPLERVLAMIDRGEIRDAKTIAALYLWERRQRGET
ncbi:MAG: NUDIX hydrolase [Phycisphaerales bacterium]|nr:MAG: NUDIX hydrolase [Phycisphaerales bacterium]